MFFVCLFVFTVYCTPLNVNGFIELAAYMRDIFKNCSNMTE